jgi:undecaprenyl diphosphate synthase
MLESIAFIPDGNRRYAEKAGISLAQSYLMGTTKAWDVAQWLSKYPSIKNGIFYTFSLKNFERSKLELKTLMHIFGKELDKVKNNKLISDNEIKLKFIGRKELFPNELKKKMDAAEKLTENNSKKTITLAIGYDGQAEIVDAAKKFATEVSSGKANINSIDENSFKKYLYADFKEPDLIIRTSNQQRLSGFLTYQSSYSELYFLDKFWPELSESDVDTAIDSFDSRQRRFGK